MEDRLGMATKDEPSAPGGSPQHNIMSEAALHL